MTTDRELLELAARAAGIHPHDIECTWNPLTDDGDALRLAVKLGLDVFCRPSQWSECGRIGNAGFREKHGTDPYAATRRAIVRAAAAIGEQA